MEQELTISDNIFSFLAEHLTFGKNIADQCIDIISENYIIDDIDKTVFKKFCYSIDKILDIKKNDHLKEVLKIWMNNNMKKLNGVYEFDWQNDFIKLCKLSNDKIYLNTELEQKDVKKIQKNNIDIEIHNHLTFINPDASKILKNTPYILELENSIFYDLNKILYPFIRNAKKIKIIEPYVTSGSNYMNFKRFTEIIPVTAESLIVTLRNSLANLEKYPRITNFNELIETLRKEGYNIRIEYFDPPENKSSKHIERYIITDKYEIYLPGGFNCLNENGYANIGKKYEKKEIRIDKIKSNKFYIE